MGVDRDYNRAVELARGEYCWLMTDDDLVKPGTVRRVLDACRNGYGFVIVNCEVRSIDFSEQIEERRLAVHEDREYGLEDTELLFRRDRVVPAVHRRRRDPEEHLAGEGKEKYYGTLFIHVGVIFQAPLPEKAYVISDPLITVRFGNAVVDAEDVRDLELQMAGTGGRFPVIPMRPSARFARRNPWNRLLVLMLDRAKGVYSIEGYRKWIAPRMKSPMHRSAPQ